jgi:sugar phosphate isomerase/epimerase
VPTKRLRLSFCSRSARTLSPKPSAVTTATPIEIARRYGAVIAVEDLPRTCLGNTAAEIAELISVHPDLRVCFDTNHLLTEDAADFVRALGDKIITTHVSDYDFLNERHWLPGEGKLDWQSIVNALREVNYSGTWLYELGFDCPKTLIRERELTCEDFSRNAAEIFENRPLTVISTVMPDLKSWK